MFKKLECEFVFASQKQEKQEKGHTLCFSLQPEDHINTKTELTVPAHIFLILRSFKKMWLVAAERWFCQKAWWDSDSYSAVNMKRHWKRLYRFIFLDSVSFVTAFLCYFKITLSKKAVQEDKEGCVTKISSYYAKQAY